MAMEHIGYWLAAWVGVMFIGFTMMTLARILAHIRERRGAERAYDRSVVPVLRFNLRKNFAEQTRAGALSSLESMEPSGMTYRLRETLAGQDVMAARAAAQVLEHIGAHSAPRRPARRSSAGFRH